MLIDRTIIRRDVYALGKRASRHFFISTQEKRSRFLVFNFILVSLTKPLYVEMGKGERERERENSKTSHAREALMDMD